MTLNTEKRRHAMRCNAWAFGIVASAILVTAADAAAPAAPVPKPAQLAAPAKPVEAASATTIPSLDAARKLPAAQLLKLATQTLVGQPRMLDYGFQLVLGPALAGDRAAIQLLAKAIDTNEYGFGEKTDAVLNTLANEAMRGSTTAIVAWGLIHDRGIDIPRDEAKAYEWYRWAGVAGSDTGAELTALDLAQGKGVAADKVQAMSWADRIKLAPKRAEAYLALAKVFVGGSPDVQDLALGQQLALKSAAVDPANAYYAGVLLVKHTTDPAVMGQARQLINDAAGRKDPKAQLYLASLTDTSSQVDPATVDPLYVQLAAIGDDQAMSALAKTLSQVSANPEALARTIEVLKTGATNGSVVAMMALSNAYFYGVGTAVSFETAAQYYRQAADAGNAEAQYQLGLMYANAIGMPADKAQAEYWLQKAAHAGYPMASLSLASLQSAP